MNRENVQEIINAPSCCKELRKVATDWMDNKVSDEELLKEIKEDITTIDSLIALTQSEMGKTIFGEEGAKEMNKKAKEAKEKGEKYCLCPACQACKKVLEG